MTLPITVDRAGPQHVKIRWDEVPSAEERGRRAAAGLADSLRGGGTGAFADAFGAAARPTRDTGDHIGRLERLAALHQQGVLTDEEFEAEKRRILDGA